MLFGHVSDPGSEGVEDDAGESCFLGVEVGDEFREVFGADGLQGGESLGALVAVELRGEAVGEELESNPGV